MDAPSKTAVAPSNGKMDLAAHAEAMKQGKGVAVYEGKLIENLHVENAQRVVALSEAIAAREPGNGQTRGVA